MTIEVRKSTAGKSKYCVRIRDKVRTYFPSKTFDRKTDAKKFERELILKRDSGALVQGDEKKRMLTADYFNIWFEHVSLRQSKSWNDSVIRMTQTYILPAIGHIKLQDVRAPDIGRVLGSMKSNGLKSQTMLHVFNIINGAFKASVEYFCYLDRNPVSKQDRPKIHRVERSYLVPQDAWKLLEVARDHQVGPAVWLAVLSGLRTSEIQALTWGSVDFSKRQILIRAAYKRGIRMIEPFPKQKDWAIVPMPEPLYDYLLPLSHRKFPKDLVVSGKERGILDQKVFWKGIASLCEKAQVPKVSPHELRHTCTEIWIDLGASIEDIRRLLNHKSAETTQRYIHRTDDRLLSLASAMVLPKLKEA
jgi:integrase